MPAIRIADEFTKSYNEAPISFEFGEKGLSGAEVFARACKNEGLAALFCCPGNYTVINSISAAGIPAYGVSGLFSDTGNNGVHGLNEQVGVKELYDSKEFLYRLVKALSGKANAAQN